MFTRRSLLALVGVLAAIGLFASCGGEDQGLTEQAASGDLGGSGRGDPADDPLVPNDDPVDGSLTTDDPDDPSGGEAADFCGLWSEFALFYESWGADGESADDRRAAHEQFEASADDLLDAAPDDITDDVESLVDATAAVLDVYEDHDYDAADAESDPAIEEPSGDLFTAYGRVDDYAAAHCAGSSEPSADTVPVTADTVAPGEAGTGGAASDDFCAVWNEFATVDASLTGSPEELRDLYADFDEKAEQFVDAAPDEIRADAETVADASRAMRDLLEEYDYDFSAASLDPAFAEAFNEDALDASLRVADYAIANC